MTRLIEWSGHGWLSLSARLYIGGLFVYASWHKIVHPELFALDVATYDILPLVLVNPMAIILPYVEFIAGVMLIVGFRTRAGAVLVTGMLIMFTIALALALAKGLDVACGCFASQAMEEDPISRMTLLRDFLWILLAVYILIFHRNGVGIDRMIDGPSRA
jgi:uncharacterized membrane protein YphA (DoxX/SURF4 family)